MSEQLRRLDRYLLELGAGVIVLAVANVVLRPADPGFLDLQPNPALLLAAIVGARYGMREGLMAALVTGGLVLACALARSDDLTLRTLSRVDTYLPPILVLATGFVFGAIGDRRRRQTAGLTTRVDALEQELADQAVRFMAAAEAKHELERRVTEESASLANLYAAARALETLDLERLYPAITETTRRLLQADACQLYVLDGDILRLRAAEGPPPPKAELGLDEGLVGLAVRQGKAVSVRELMTVSSLDDLQRAPMLLAAAVTGPDHTVLGCLTVTRLPFLKLGPAALDRMGVIADWAARSLENARIHAKTRASVIADDLVGAYTYAYYQRRLEEEQARADRYGRPLCVVIFRIHELERIPPARRVDLGRLLSRVFSRSVRNVDLICRYATEDSFALILPETSRVDAEEVVARVATELHAFHFLPYVDEHRDLEFSLRVLALRDGQPPRGGTPPA